MEHLDHKQKVMIMLAVMSAMLFASLNQTIIGTSLPKIIADLGGMEYFNWVFTMFMLTSSVSAILVGKLSDIYGRRRFILLGLGIFIIGSLLAGLSSTIIQLIINRGIQGIGAGMIMSTAFTAVGDLFSPRERGRWQGLMSGVFGVSSVFGPTLGGWIVDNADWHWIFWIFLPVGFIAFFAIYKLFPAVVPKEKEPVDYLGSFFITMTMVPMLLAFSWAGTRYAWSSLEIFGLFTVSLTALGIFVMIESKAKSPVLPLELFKNPIFTLSNLVNFIMGAGMFGAIMYAPFFVQGVIGTSATISGLVIAPMTLSMVTASAIIGQVITKTGRYKILASMGLLIMALGMLAMSYMGTKTTNIQATLYMIIVGFGLGISFPIFTLTVQNAVEHKMLGVVTASTQLFRQLGGTVGVAIMGIIMNNRLLAKMENLTEDIGPSLRQLDPDVAAKLTALKNPQVLMDTSKLEQIQNSLSPETQTLFLQMVDILREALSYSLSGVFLSGSLMIFLALLLSFLVKEVPLRSSNQSESKASHREPIKLQKSSN